MTKSTEPKTYSSNPEALKQANPKRLTEAQRNYRDLLLRQDAERLMRHSSTPEYLFEISNMLTAEANKRLPPEHARRELEPTKPTDNNNKKDIFS